jgi:hypothetical protein
MVSSLVDARVRCKLPARLGGCAVLSEDSPVFVYCPPKKQWFDLTPFRTPHTHTHNKQNNPKNAHARQKQPPKIHTQTTNKTNPKNAPAHNKQKQPKNARANRYATKLELVQKLFVVTLGDGKKPALDPKEMREIFGNIESIYKFHGGPGGALEQLRTVLNDPTNTDGSGVGKLLFDLAPHV